MWQYSEDGAACLYSAVRGFSAETLIITAASEALRAASAVLAAAEARSAEAEQGADFKINIPLRLRGMLML